jgi:MFS transporter, CP family, cyanate transporter
VPSHKHTAPAPESCRSPLLASLAMEDRRGAAERSGPGLPMLLGVLVLLGFQLRGPLVAIAPVAREAQRDWAITAPALGLLTSLPLLCFGLTTPIALLLLRRFGVEMALLVGLIGVVAATVLRSFEGYAVALAASVLLGAAITVGNVLVPTLIRRDVPDRGRGPATGLYTVSLNVATMLTALATVPLAALVGWRAAIGAWAVLGALTVGAWLLVLRPRITPAPPRSRHEERPPFLRSALPWVLTATFSAQAFSYYGLTTWLPTLLAEERGFDAATAGSASSIFQVAGALGAIGVPLLALRLKPWQTLGILGVLWISLPAGLLLVPEQFALLSVFGGIAQGGGFAAIFTIVARAGRDAREATALSAFVQTGGYLAAAVAPPLLGALRQATGGWTVPVVVVLGTTTAFLAFGLLASTVATRRLPARPVTSRSVATG